MAIRKAKKDARRNVAVQPAKQDDVRSMSVEKLLGQLIERVVFKDASLEEADAVVAEFLVGRTEKELEAIGKTVLPLTSRLVSAASVLASMFHSRIC